MKTAYRSITLLWLSFISLSIQAQTELEIFLNQLNTLYGRFEQKLYSETGELLEISRGELFIERPDRFRWDYQTPYQQQIIADGTRIWIYEPDLEQVTVKPMDKALDKTPAQLLSSSHTRLADNFTVKPLPADPNTQYRKQFEVVPKATDSQFVRLHISLYRNDLETFELLDNLGQTTLITFSHTRRNENFAKGLFRFSPPAGTDVIMD